MPAIYPVTAGRVSDQLIQQRLLSQFGFNRDSLVKLQDQMSTGLRLAVPSDDATAALRAITLQRLLEQKEQAEINLGTGRSFLAATDNAMQGISEIVTNIRADALGVADTTASERQRQAVATEVGRVVERLADIGNQNFRGRYLFAGSATTEPPFEMDSGNVVYEGNQGSLRSFVDVGFLADTNIDGHRTFGTISAEVRGMSDLNPILTPNTRLSDLPGQPGGGQAAFLVSDGNTTSTIDISSAETIGDVARLIEANPPQGRQLVARVSTTGLILDLDDAGGGSLTIREVTAGNTAAELGILETHGAGVLPLVGEDLNPPLRATTRLADILGTRATALLSTSGANNDFVIEAPDNGPQANGVTVQFVANLAAGDSAIVNYDPLNQLLEIDINPGTTTANSVVQAINDSGAFSARLDKKLDPLNDGSGTVDLTATAITAGGAGIVLDQQSGLQVVNGGETYVITFEEAETIEDLLNTLNSSAAHLLAEISADGQGIDVRSRLSGSDFQVGENGGTTATELGIRSFHTGTTLAELNYDRGVDTATGTDFVIHRKDGVELDVDISSAVTIGDVIDLINNHPDNTGDTVQARLAAFGNGLELFDENVSGPDVLSVSRDRSFASWDLGLVAHGQDQSTATAATVATATVSFAAPFQLNTAMQLTADQTGFGLNGVNLVFQDTLSGDAATATFDALSKQLTVEIDASQTTANSVIAAVTSSTPFTASLDTSSDPTNDGSGVVGTTGTVATTSGGASESVHGTDPNPLEVKGVFNSLLRLEEALLDFDLPEIERTIQMLDNDLDRLSFARADIGSQARNFEVLQVRLDNEEVELKSTLSQHVDTDLVEAISNLTAMQASMEATLRLIGRSLQLTVLSFL